MNKILSIIIPVFNEEKTIEAILKKVLKQEIAGWQKEIIVVDDGSRDKTEEKIKPFLKEIKFLKHPLNRGKGAAIGSGLKAAKGEAIIIQDADLEYEPADWPLLLKELDEPEVMAVYGSRELRPGWRGYPHYVFGVRLLTFVTNLLFGSNLTDVYTGYKLFRSSLIKSIPLTSSRFEIEAEMTAKLLKKGVIIKEIPIHYYPRSFAEGKHIRIKDGLLGLLTLIKCRPK